MYLISECLWHCQIRVESNFYQSKINSGVIGQGLQADFCHAKAWEFISTPKVWWLLQEEKSFLLSFLAGPRLMTSEEPVNPDMGIM